MTLRPLVIGIGHRLRKDDAVGPMVIDRLLSMHADIAIDVLELSGEGAALIEAWDGRGTVVVVDAMRSGRPPGTIVTLDAVTEPCRAEVFRQSSHQFGLAAAIETARVLGRLPRHLIVVGVEGEQFGFGEGLTPAVASALDAALALVRAAIADRP